MTFLLLGVDSSGNAKLGLPQTHEDDNFNDRAEEVGLLKGFSHILFSPDGIMFAVRGADIYCGLPPLNPTEDWLKMKAKCVGRAYWNQFRLLFFHPDGMLYAITKEDKLFKGLPPDNMHMPWLYRVATEIGNSGWNFPRVFFDPKGMMYAVTKCGKLVKGEPPSNAYDEWLKRSQIIGNRGWAAFTHCLAFLIDEKVTFYVSDKNGKIYCAPPPEDATVNWFGKVKKIGKDYNHYKILTFAEDKSISKVLGVDFLVDNGKILSAKPMIIGQHIYDNTKGSIEYTTTFEFSEKVSLESTFSHKYGFTFALGASTKFKAGIPMIAQNETAITLDISTTHTWDFSETTRTEIVRSSSVSVTVPPGKALRFKAIIQKGDMDVPYKAQAVTEFGHKTTVTGTWKGASVSRVEIEEDDITNEKVKETLISK
ncbi:TAL2 protein, partial [Amia calva]|nr:TAL2 protein [Amia calva]